MRRRQMTKRVRKLIPEPERRDAEYQKE